MTTGIARRPLMRALAASGLGWASGAAAPAATYAESVEMMLFAPDGSRDMSVRLARLVDEGRATLWANYGSAERNYGMAAETALADGGRTAVAEDRACFAAPAPWAGGLSRSGRSTATLTGVVDVSAGLFETAEPRLGDGPLRGRFEMSFRAGHPPVVTRGGRLEVFGLGRGRLVLPDRELTVSGVAKWHEQVGERPRFAPAFTYLALAGERRAILAISLAAGANGFVAEDARTTPLSSFTVARPGPRRAFSATLADGRAITGELRTLRTSSEPIEGARRPSATVLAETSVGPMTGQINDWTPP